MTTLRAIHFPETTLSTQDVMGQLLLFDTISYITPTPTEEEVDPYCLPYDAAPLGEDAERFSQLLAELKGNEAAFYQGQMSKLALEYLETRQDDTVRDIIGSIHGQKKNDAEPGQDKEYEKLWKDRLLLKLAEIKNREEQEIHHSLQRIKDAQADLLGDLQGEEEFQDLFHALANNQPSQTPVRVESLIKAWGHLFNEGEEHFSILHCFSPEAAEPYMEASEALTGKRPVRLLRLPLPHCAACPEEFARKKESWEQSNKPWLDELKTCLHHVVQNGLEAVPLATFSKLAGQWGSQVDQADLWPEQFPTKECGPPALEIYLLGDGIGPLTTTLCNLRNKKEYRGDRHALLAVVSSRPNSCT